MLYQYKKELLKIQRELIDGTKMGIVIIDKEGEYITEKSNYSEFCELFRKNPTLCSFCEKCDLKALNKAFLSSKPYIYRCHAGLIDAIIPIVYDGELIGAFLVGQILLEDEENFNIDFILNENLGKKVNFTKLKESYHNLKKIKLSELKSIVNLIYYTTFYITDCIKTKKWKQLEIHNNIINKKIDLSYSQIAPALKYINEHLEKNISLKELATLCNMSISTFTRVFKKETDKNFKEYIILKKIEKAKFLIENSNKTLTEISNTLNFEDSSYFTKIFKKYEGLTPKQFRENLFSSTKKAE